MRKPSIFPTVAFAFGSLAIACVAASWFVAGKTSGAAGLAVVALCMIGLTALQVHNRRRAMEIWQIWGKRTAPVRRISLHQMRDEAMADLDEDNEGTPT